MRNSKLWLGLSVALEVWSDSTGGAAASKSVRQAADADSAGFSPHEWTIINTLSPLPDLPVDPTNKYRDSAAAALLGQKLFFEPRVSGPIQQGTPAEGQLGAIGEKGKIACRNCHMPESTWLIDIRSNNGGPHLWTAGPRSLLCVSDFRGVGMNLPCLHPTVPGYPRAC